MSDVITTAGRPRDIPTRPDARKDMIRLIRTALRKPDATDDEVDGALEALVELAKE